MLPTYKICLNTCQSYWVKYRFEFVLYTLICTFISLKILNFPLFTWSLLQSDVKESLFTAALFVRGSLTILKLCICVAKLEFWMEVWNMSSSADSGFVLTKFTNWFFFFIKELDVVIPVKRHRPWMISISDKIVSDIV